MGLRTEQSRPLVLAHRRATLTACTALIMAVPMSLLGTVVVATEDPDPEIPNQTEEDLDSTAPTVEQRRAHYRAARQQARIERISNTAGTPPDQNVSQSPDLHQGEPARAAGALADMGVSFMLNSPGGAGLQATDQWRHRMSGVREGAVTFRAKVEGRDSAGLPLDISPEWIPADPSAVLVTPARGYTVTLTVRGEGASNVTVRALGISKDIWILATLDQRNALRAEISQ